jgi:hypothetical protein
MKLKATKATKNPGQGVHVRLSLYKCLALVENALNLGVKVA